MERKKIIILIAGTGIFLLFIFFVTLGISIRPQETQTPPTQEPSTQQLFPGEEITITQPPQSTEEIPIDPDSGAVNPENPEVDESVSELSKLEPILPYRQELTLSSGEQVLLSISKNVLAETPWILPVYIGGLDFAVPEETPDYEPTKRAFKEAARYTLQLIASQGVDTSKIYIRWSDNPAEQERLEQWINE